MRKQSAISPNQSVSEPGVASTHYSLGRALLLVQRSDEAQAEFTEAVRLQPEYPEAYFLPSSCLGARESNFGCNQFLSSRSAFKTQLA